MSIKPVPLALALVAISILLFALMLRLYLNIPHVADLYNQVYYNSRINKPENTEVFLFVFPTFCLLVGVTSPTALWLKIRKEGAVKAEKVLLPIGVFGLFVFGTLIRYRAVSAYYGV